MQKYFALFKLFDYKFTSQKLLAFFKKKKQINL